MQPVGCKGVSVYKPLVVFIVLHSINIEKTAEVFSNFMKHTQKKHGVNKLSRINLHEFGTLSGKSGHSGFGCSASGLLNENCSCRLSELLLILDQMIFGEGTFSWQDPVHSWKAGPGEVMTGKLIKGPSI